MKGQSQHSSTSKKTSGPPPVAKRAFNQNTAGGNAYTGGTADASGGDVYNFSNDDANTVSNTNSSKHH